ncbi:MAG: NUDIX hydrolase [Parcubacteria group bacterium]|nr:NUDIX hydrolase [Parcubacteria group bacterium]
MKTRQRVFCGEMRSKARLEHGLIEILESYQGELGHVSVFCVPVRVNRRGVDIATCISGQRGITPKDLEICLVSEEEDDFIVNGQKITKPEGWGLVGGGVDIVDILNDGGEKERPLPKEKKNAIVRELLNKATTDELLVIIESALYREVREEAGLTVDPFWGLFKIDPKENDDGTVNIVVTVLCEVLSMSDERDEEEIREKRFFLTEHIVEAIKTAPIVPGKPRWMYTSHARRLRKILTFFGRDFEGVITALQHMFGKY